MQRSRPEMSEARMKLREKLKGFKNHVPANKQMVTEKEYKKMMSEVRKELKNLQEDPRVTPRMMELYQKVSQEYTQVKIPSPVELLNNQEDAKEKLREYFASLIDKCKQMNITKEKFISDYLNSSYTEYYVNVLGSDVIPETLRANVIYCQNNSEKDIQI
jgi:hypothetical protein